ncbi:LPS export ABC transporter periplasmic protein LptC, partial [uncultured Cetobacterium sp.]|uniref:LPS export ABC transporter periplasmic protein LptC n=1 Tax=uncultured Cetobacterium sp. TaxID=527638 RepID=UPI00260F2E3D
MDKKKLVYRVIIVILLVLGYFNYFGDEKKIEKKEEVIETTGAVYDTDGYHIEAEKQRDFVKKNETTFEKAKALLGDMVLTGDNAILDAGKNLLLKTNILGKSLNGWEFKTEKVDYDKEKDLVQSNVGVVAINKAEGIEISGKNFSSDTKMDNLNLSGDVKFKTKNITLSAENAKYSDKTKIMEILGESYLTSKDDSQGLLGGHFKILKYNTETNNLTSNKSFVITYNGMKLFGDNLIYNDKTEAFKITENVHMEIDGYKISMVNITSNGGNEILFKGEIKGSNGIYSFSGDNAIYNKETKMFYLKNNVTAMNKDGAKLNGDEAIYNTQLKIL